MPAEPRLGAACPCSREAHAADVTEVWKEFTEGRYSDQYFHILLAAVYGVVSLLFDGSLDVLHPGQSDADEIGDQSFEDFLDTTFDYLRNGFQPKS